MLSGAGVIQAQQKVDPLTITNTGNVGIGTPAPANKLSVTGDADVSGNVGIGTTTPANKLSVVGNADFSGAVGIGTSSLGTSKFRIANSASDFAHFRFDATGGGEFEFVGWANGWNINTKTSGKNLYLNRDSPSNSDVVIGRFGKEMIVKGDTGNVGIGTAPQFGKLQVAGGGITALRLDANSGVAAMSIGGTGELLVDAPGATGGRFVVKDNGNVGIGTGNPTKAKLEINGSVGNYVGTYRFISLQHGSGTYSANTTIQYSVWASSNIGAGEFHSFSDARIKNIQGRSDSATDLRTLLGIEVTDYRYKDVIGHGNGAYKKVTGQQVEKVFPQAVSKHTEVVPDIYQPASIQDGWIALATDLKKGERVKLITANGEEGIHEVLEVAQEKFRIDFKPTGNRIFVYGREVKDFLAVDYEAISMLNVSATQQIKKEKDEEVKALQEENAILRGQLTEQEKRLSELEARDKARDEKLAAMEAMLLSGNQPAARNLSLKKAN